MTCSRCKRLIAGINSFHELEFAKGYLSKHIWLFEYSQVKEILCDCKYRGEYSHYRHLSKTIALAIESSSSFPLDKMMLTYVPTISSHQRDRGADHALLLARNIAPHLNANVTTTLLATHTSAQAGSSKSQRLINPHFIPVEKLSRSNVVLVDDISSTKSTLMHAAKSLEKAGAKYILAVTIANRSK